jgi:hypothetical protein
VTATTERHGIVVPSGHFPLRCNGHDTEGTMAVSASARDRFYRTIEPLLGAEQADFLMDSLPPGGWDDVATKADLAALRAEVRQGFAELRELMAQMVTRSELSEQLKLHVDASVARTNRSWLFSCMAMQAATITGVIAVVRL